MQSQDWLLILEICMQFLDFGNVQCIFGFTHTFMYRHTHLCRRKGRNTPTAVVDMDLPPPPRPSAHRFRRTVATERVEQMVRKEGELEERVPQGV